MPVYISAAFVALVAAAAAWAVAVTYRMGVARDLPRPKAARLATATAAAITTWLLTTALAARHGFFTGRCCEVWVAVDADVFGGLLGGDAAGTQSPGGVGVEFEPGGGLGVRLVVLRSIYQKLGASRRREAVRRARDLHLI